MTKRKPMTEEAWQSSNSAYEMLQYLHQHRRISRVPGGQRRNRLFRCACCRLVWDLFLEEACRRAVEVTEVFADGGARRTDLSEARQGAADTRDPFYGEVVRREPVGSPAWAAAQRQNSVSTAAVWTAASQFDSRVAHIVAMAASMARVVTVGDPRSEGAVVVRQGQERLQANLVRDIFGNPFAPPPVVDQQWLQWNQGTVLNMATGIYVQHGFEQMPILADALEDAGCDDAQILDHLRGPGPHARGCWVLDLLLGRE